MRRRVEDFMLITGKDIFITIFLFYSLYKSSHTHFHHSHSSDYLFHSHLSSLSIYRIHIYLLYNVYSYRVDFLSYANLELVFPICHLHRFLANTKSKFSYSVKIIKLIKGMLIIKLISALKEWFNPYIE